MKDDREGGNFGWNDKCIYLSMRYPASSPCTACPPTREWFPCSAFSPCPACSSWRGHHPAKADIPVQLDIPLPPALSVEPALKARAGLPVQPGLPAYCLLSLKSLSSQPRLVSLPGLVFPKPSWCFMMISDASWLVLIPPEYTSNGFCIILSYQV